MCPTAIQPITVCVGRVAVGTWSRGVIHFLTGPVVVRVLVLNRVTYVQRDGHVPNIVAVGVRHGSTVTTPAVKGSINLRGGEASRVQLHVHLEGDVCRGRSGATRIA